jgi:hypothetical protein
MLKHRTLWISIAAMIGALASAGAASAANIPCGLTASGSFSPTITYDPFSASGISSVAATLTLTRVGDSNDKTANARFYFTTPASTASGIVITTASTGAANTLIYGPPFAASPDLVNDTGAGIIHQWPAQTGADTITLAANITVPAGVDLTAGPTIPFGIRYVCTGSGNVKAVNTPTEITGAFTLNVKVLSALQASYAGPALAFGEIGSVTTASLAGTPRVVSGNVRVASSGPYTVAMTSSNNYRLRVGASGDTIGYTAHFLGQNRTNGSPTFTTINCAKAGVAGVNLPITATLTEGGSGKAPSTSYVDVLTVTVTPFATGSLSAPQTCSTIP